jgi:hypothetical protein
MKPEGGDSLNGDWFHVDPPTRIQTLLSGTVIPAAAVILLVDILVGLFFLRWALKNRRLVLRSILIADLLLLVASTVFLVWATGLSYGSFGLLGILSLTLSMRYTYEMALFSFLPAFAGEPADESSQVGSKRRRHLLPWFGSVPFLVFCLVALASLLYPTPGKVLPAVLMGLAAVGGVCALVVGIVVPVTLPGRLRIAGASRRVLRMARFAWCPIGLQFGFLALLLFQLLVRFSSSLPAAGFWTALSTYGYYAIAVVLYVLPSAGIVGTTVALLRHARERGMEKPASPPASPSFELSP